LIELRQKLLKQDVIIYVLRSKDILILFGIRKTYESSGTNLLLYQFMKGVIKLIVAVIEECYFYPLYAKFYPVFFSHILLHM